MILLCGRLLGDEIARMLKRDDARAVTCRCFIADCQHRLAATRGVMLADESDGSHGVALHQRSADLRAKCLSRGSKGLSRLLTIHERVLLFWAAAPIVASRRRSFLSRFGGSRSSLCGVPACGALMTRCS